jgi:hypothetical protein
MNATSKRSYIHRKKYLNESITQIKSTLEFIHLARNDSASPEESHKAALAHAQSIEAVCWSPHSHLTAEDYQRIMAAKTQELCWTLIRTAILSLDREQLQRLGPRLLEPAAAPPRAIPLPVFSVAPGPPDEPWQPEPWELDMRPVLGEAREFGQDLSPFEGLAQEHEPFV